MPNIHLDKERVLSILGKKINDDELKEKISYLGTDLEEINKEEIIVEIFPNRPDLLSEEGFGRALKSFLGLEKGLKKYETKKSDYEVIINKSVSKVRPYTACLVAKNLKITNKILDDIINIQEKLHITYGRNRKKCAIGVYPMDNIIFPIHYTAMKPEGIQFIPLGEKEEMNGCELLEKTKAGKEYGSLLKNENVFPLFVDSNNNIMSVPPILNSKHTGTVDTNTKNLFVECSGHDFEVLSKALNMIGTALADMGADIYSVKLKYEDKEINTPNFESETMILNKDYVTKYLGKSLKEEEIKELLEKMGFGVKEIKEGKLEVLIPCYRTDILHPVDLIEDICISYGFYNIESEKDNVHSVGKEFFQEKVEEKIRDILVGDGLIEFVSYSLTNSKQQKELGFQDCVLIKNPNTSEYDSLRKSLIITMLKNFKNNKMNEYPQKIFEIGKVFKKENEIVSENNNLCVATCSDNASFTWAKQRINLLAKSFGLDLIFEEKEFPHMIKGRSAEIKTKKEKETLGILGEINLNTLRNYELEHAISLFEINTDLFSKLIEEQNKL